MSFTPDPWRGRIAASRLFGRDPRPIPLPEDCADADEDEAPPPAEEPATPEDEPAPRVSRRELFP